MDKTLSIKSKEALETIKADFKAKQASFDYTVLICSGAGCISSNCEAVKTAFDEALAKLSPDKKIDIKLTGCMGTCNIGPAMIVQPGNVFYCKLNPEDMETIVTRHIVEGGIAEEFCTQDEKNRQSDSMCRGYSLFHQSAKNCFEKLRQHRLPQHGRIYRVRWIYVAL